MPPLKNAKHEAFARNMYEGMTGSKAYLDAGYKCTHLAAETSASALLGNPKITARIAELAGQASTKVARKIALTKEWVVEQMIDAAMEAAEDKHHGARIRAVELLGRETGNFTEQKRVSIRSFTDMTADEIEAFLAGSSSGPAPKKADSRRKGGTRKA